VIPDKVLGERRAVFDGDRVDARITEPAGHTVDALSASDRPFEQLHAPVDPPAIRGPGIQAHAGTVERDICQGLERQRPCSDLDGIR